MAWKWNKVKFTKVRKSPVVASLPKENGTYLTYANFAAKVTYFYNKKFVLFPTEQHPDFWMKITWPEE